MTTVEPIRKIEDIRKVERILAEQSSRNLLFFTIGTNWGLRISDIVGLDVKDVRGKNYVQLTEKKTGKFKKLFINSKLKPMIEDYTKDKPENTPLIVTIFGNRLDRFAAYHI